MISTTDKSKLHFFSPHVSDTRAEFVFYCTAAAAGTCFRICYPAAFYSEQERTAKIIFGKLGVRLLD